MSQSAKLTVACICVIICLSFSLGCFGGKDKEVIYNKTNQTTRDFLLKRGCILPKDVAKGEKSFSKVEIIYNFMPEEWKIDDNYMIWVTGNEPSSIISYRFTLK